MLETDGAISVFLTAASVYKGLNPLSLKDRVRK